jgi:hypothetical protein
MPIAGASHRRRQVIAEPEQVKAQLLALADALGPRDSEPEPRANPIG